MTMAAVHRPKALGLRTADLLRLRSLLEEQRDFRVDQLVMLERAWPATSPKDAAGEITTTLVRGARAALHEVYDALERIGDCTYGLCCRCHRVMPQERLEVLPQVALCLPCQRDA